MSQEKLTEEIEQMLEGWFKDAGEAYQPALMFKLGEVHMPGARLVPYQGADEERVARDEYVELRGAYEHYAQMADDPAAALSSVLEEAWPIEIERRAVQASLSSYDDVNELLQELAWCKLGTFECDEQYVAVFTYMEYIEACIQRELVLSGRADVVHGLLSCLTGQAVLPFAPLHDGWFTRMRMQLDIVGKGLLTFMHLPVNYRYNEGLTSDS